MVCLCPLKDGVEANTYLAGMFGTCVYNSQEMASLIFSWISLIIWAFSQWPPIRLNFLINDASALSAFLCFTWMFTDLANLISNFLLNMMIGQKILAILWFVLDFVLVLQVLLYSWQKRRAYKAAGVYPLPPLFIGCGKQKSENGNNKTESYINYEKTETEESENKVDEIPLMAERIYIERTEETDESGEIIKDEDGYRYTKDVKEKLMKQLKRYHTFDMTLLTQKEKDEFIKLRARYSPLEITCYVLLIGIVISNLGWAGKEGDTALHGDTTKYKNCAEDMPPSSDTAIYWAGTVISYICPVFYIASRVGQIVKNCKRKSVTGLSLGLFICSLMANLAQAISLIVFSWDIDHQIRSIPFVAAALLPMICDIVILAQARKYNKLTANLIKEQEASDKMAQGITENVSEITSVVGANDQ